MIQNLIDFCAKPTSFVPFAISIGAAFWSWFTSRNVETLKNNLATKASREIEHVKADLSLQLNRDVEHLKISLLSTLRREETVLEIASAMESRLHERDVAALQECQKYVAKFHALCSKSLWSMSDDNEDGAKVAELWSEAFQTYFYLRPSIALAPPPQRKNLETAADEMLSALMSAHKKLDDNGSIEPVEPAQKLLLLQNLECVEQLDDWAKALRNHQMTSVLDAARKLSSEIQTREA